MALRIGLFVVAALLLGAHFYRAGNLLLAALCSATPLLFLYRKRWTLILLQLMAYGAAAIWLETAIRLVEFRQQIGRPWTAAAIILGAVALFTFVAGLLLNSRSIARRYEREQAHLAEVAATPIDAMPVSDRARSGRPPPCPRATSRDRRP